MTKLELLTLILVLVKFRAIYAMSHRKRDLIDEMVVEAVKAILMMEKPTVFDHDYADEGYIPF